MKKSAILTLCIILTAMAGMHAEAATRTATVEAHEATSPAISASPDGKTIIISMLGHLLELPVAGGTTRQLTFGPSYDSDPAVSPDGQKIVFVSNRDGSGSNIFIYDRTTRRVRQLTHDVEATRPAWSPDGATIAYARNIPRDEHPRELMPGFADTGLRELRTVPAAGGSAQVIGKPQSFETVFYLADGRLAWSVRELGPGGMMGPRVTSSRIEALDKDGSIARLAETRGDIGRVTPSPRGGVYYSAAGAIQYLSYGAGTSPVPGPKVRENGGRVAVAANGMDLIFADAGQLWSSAGGSAEPQRIDFTARVEVQALAPVRHVAKFAAPGGKAALRAVQAPTLAPDGRHYIVMAGGFLWQQPLDGKPATRLFNGNAFMRNPVYSPDGRKLAYVASENGKRRLDVYDIESRQVKTLFSVGGAEWPLFPSWSPDGRQIVFQHSSSIGAAVPLIVIDISSGQQREVARAVGSWLARPQFSADGKSLYFSSRPDKIAALYQVRLDGPAEATALTRFSRHVHEAQVSPDGKWFAQRRNSGIWLAPMSASGITDADLHRVSEVGGRSFAFTPDSTAIVFSDSGKVFRLRVPDGKATRLPTRIEVATPAPAPLLLSNIRVLDFKARNFSAPQSMLVENGRIRWIGAEAAHRLPSGVVRIDGQGRYAIPGLFDAHVHTAWMNQQASEDAYIAFGVTSVRDTGGSLDLLNALDDRSRYTTAPAPRFFYSGEIMEGTMPLWGDEFYTIANEQEARAEVRHLKARGASFVKVYPSLPWNLQGAVADEAHRIGLPMVGHGLSPEEMIRRVLWGSESIEHNQVVVRVYEDIHNLLAATHMPADLTLAVGGRELMAASDPQWLQNWRVLEYVPESSRRGGAVTKSRSELLDTFKDRLDRIHKAHDRGVIMPTGTDSLMGGVYFGLSLHWELGQFADAGIAPIDVLHSSTQGGADLVGASRDLGSLEPGKLADVVLLDRNPLEDIRNTQAIWRVIKGGTVHDPRTLRPGIEAP